MQAVAVQAVLMITHFLAFQVKLLGLRLHQMNLSEAYHLDGAAEMFTAITMDFSPRFGAGNSQRP